jgi:hypothetical protein
VLSYRLRAESITIDILVLARLMTEEIHVAWPWKPPSLLPRDISKSVACRLQNDEVPSLRGGLKFCQGRRCAGDFRYEAVHAVRPPLVLNPLYPRMYFGNNQLKANHHPITR